MWPFRVPLVWVFTHLIYATDLLAVRYDGWDFMVFTTVFQSFLGLWLGMKLSSDYRISQSSLDSVWLQINIPYSIHTNNIVFFFGYQMDFFLSITMQKNLALCYKMDLDLLEIFTRVKLVL